MLLFASRHALAERRPVGLAWTVLCRDLIPNARLVSLLANPLRSGNPHHWSGGGVHPNDCPRKPGGGATQCATALPLRRELSRALAAQR